MTNDEWGYLAIFIFCLLYWAVARFRSKKAEAKKRRKTAHNESKREDYKRRL